jgi:hypothetical protein
MCIQEIISDINNKGGKKIRNKKEESQEKIISVIRDSQNEEGLDVYEMFRKMNGEIGIMRIRQICEQLVILNKLVKTKIGKKNKYKVIIA